MGNSIDGSRGFTTHPKCEFHSLKSKYYLVVIFPLFEKNLALIIFDIVNESAGDTDAVIQSSDGVIFHLHWKYLRMNPRFVRDIAKDSSSNETQETMALDEPSDVLEILFQFIYPRRHPSLEDTDFETLAAVAEAVEKYQVFSAMNLCALRLE